MTPWNKRQSWSLLAFTGLLLTLFQPLVIASSSFPQGNSGRSLTLVQIEIDKQRGRLNAPEIEDRRDAVVRLGVLHHPEASRAALVALKDPAAIVRATAVVAVLSLPAEESAASLIPLLDDKDEFVRQEAAYALGKTGSRTSVAPLILRLLGDKKDGVRGAAAVALGDIGDETGVVALAQVLRPELAMASSSKRNSKVKENVLVLRAAAHSLGQIGSRAGVPALMAAVLDEKSEDDIRREAAEALGLIGDPAALPALNTLSSATDPYLSAAASKASRRISHKQAGRQ